MSLATIGGILFGFGMIIGAIVHGTTNYWSFLSMEGFLIVIGGSLANAFMSYQARYVIMSLKAIVNIVKKPPVTRETLTSEIRRVINWAYIVQTKGLVGLEPEGGRKIPEPLVRFGLDMVISGYKPEDIRAMMETSIDATFDRECVPVPILKNMAGTAPAFGMVGTLVGMVIMLGNIGEDMSAIGSGMSIALLATLYGVVSARLIYMPAADKLKQKQEIIRFRNTLVAEGLAMLAEKKPPRFIQDRLNSFLDPAIHFNIDTMKR